MMGRFQFCLKNSVCSLWMHPKDTRSLEAHTVQYIVYCQYLCILWDTVALVQTVICSIFHLPLQSPIRLRWRREWPKLAGTRRSQVQHGVLWLRLRDCMKRRGSRQRQSRCHATRGLISYCECATGGLCCRWALTVQYSGAG
jgi:hypothetical protein